MKPGDRNAYVCERCGEAMITVDRDEGTTPMMLFCRFGGCSGMMKSMMYRLPPDLADREPTHEWYKPSLKWARRQGPAMLDHVQRGGLALREIT